MPHTKKTELIVALDVPHVDTAYSIVQKLHDLPVIFKIGSELFLHSGPDLVKGLVHEKQRIFLDLKFHDIPNTVVQAAKAVALMHVEMFTLHLSGGSRMVQSVTEAFREIPALRPKVLGVSVLTSFDDVQWAEVTKTISGHAIEVKNSAERLIAEGIRWGVDGIVCSAFELEFVTKNFPQTYAVVPGIRPAGSEKGDQARVMTPKEAKQKGASAIVVGRPITQSSDPRAIAEQILSEIV